MSIPALPALAITTGGGVNKPVHMTYDGVNLVCGRNYHYDLDLTPIARIRTIQNGPNRVTCQVCHRMVETATSLMETAIS